MRMNTKGGIAGKAPARGKWRRYLSVLAGLLLLPISMALTSACEGDNLFSEAPAQEEEEEEESLSAMVSAQSSYGVSRVIFSVDGATAFDDVVSFEPALQDVNAVVHFQVPVSTISDEITVQAWVVDARGRTTRVLEVDAELDGSGAGSGSWQTVEGLDKLVVQRSIQQTYR